jgi:hypothetical protein
MEACKPRLLTIWHAGSPDRRSAADCTHLASLTLQSYDHSVSGSRERREDQLADDRSDVQEVEEDDIARLERLILAGDTQQSEARLSLRRFLFRLVGEFESDGSIGDALALLAKGATKNRTAAVVLLRCLSVPGLIPEPNSGNQISRLLVEVCEGAAPLILSFLKLDKKLQTYEKFEILRSCHVQILNLLKPLSDRYGDLSAVISARKEIMGALNHSIVREYCSAFRLNEVKSIIESVFGSLQRVYQLDVSFLSAVTECNRRVANASNDFVGTETFLTEESL